MISSTVRSSLEKLNELVDKADGIELKGHGKNTLLSIANNVTHIYAMNERWEDVSPSFTPFYAFDVRTQGLWATLWAGVYLELEEEHGIPSGVGYPHAAPQWPPAAHR